MVPSDYVINFRREQFPIKSCFSMSINKSQGQTLKVCGINLTSPVFSHGQLYVGCSRVTNSKLLFIYAPNKMSKNIVYKAIL